LNLSYRTIRASLTDWSSDAYNDDYPILTSTDLRKFIKTRCSGAWHSKHRRRKHGFDIQKFLGSVRKVGTSVSTLYGTHGHCATVTTLSQKQCIKFFIISPNTSKFFHCQTHLEICNVVTSKITAHFTIHMSWTCWPTLQVINIDVSKLACFVR